MAETIGSGRAQRLGRGPEATPMTANYFDDSPMEAVADDQYPHLVAVEYTGDRMLSLDFGNRQFVIEGTGLADLARHLQSGFILMMQAYNDEVWSACGDIPVVFVIRKMP
jgi:hypothetical protein